MCNYFLNDVGYCWKFISHSRFSVSARLLSAGAALLKAIKRTFQATAILGILFGIHLTVESVKADALDSASLGGLITFSMLAKLGAATYYLRKPYEEN